MKITEAKTTIQCPAKTQSRIPVELELNEEPADKFYRMEVDVHTVEGYCIGSYSIPIISDKGIFANNLFSLVKEQNIGMDTIKLAYQLAEWFQKYPLMRVGRKFSMSEELRAKDKAIEKYLIEPTEILGKVEGEKWIQKADYINSSISSSGEVIYETLANGGIGLNYSFTPHTKGKMLLESGSAFLLNNDYKHIQWIGFGPYASYPGKQSANGYGLHSVSVDNLYFEGNRMGIDALVCTDDAGNGFLVIAPHSNINFEQTDKGIVLSFNAVVSGLCGKLRETAYPVYTDDVEQISGNILLYPLLEGKWPEAVTTLFEQPKDMEPSENPFLSEYDTYLMKYLDIVD